jgi:CBS domain-containing protein
MASVRELLTKKGAALWHVSPETTVFEALQLMAQKNIGCLLVLSDGQLEGIFSERDYARKIILKGRSSKETPVGEIMTSPVFSVVPEQTIRDCMALMSERHIRHLPVLERGRVVGMVSISDVVNWVINEQQTRITQLEQSIKTQ